MRGISKLKAIVGGAVLAVGAFFAINAVYSTTDAATCSANDVIYCGVTSLKQLRDRYNNDYTKGTKAIYSYFGITSNTVNKATAKKGTLYRDGRVVVDGKTVATGAHTVGRHHQPGSTKHTSGSTTFYSGPANVRLVRDAREVFVFFDANGLYMSAIMLDCGNPVVKAKPVEPPKPKPEYSCVLLKVTPQTRNSFKFNAESSAKNATYKGFTFEFGDGKSKFVPSTTKYGETSHTYTKDGNFTAKVYAHFMVNGKEQKVTAATCTKPVPVKPEPPKPTAQCVELTQARVGAKSFRLNAKADTKDGATISAYHFTVRNVASATPVHFEQTVRTSAKEASVTTGNIAALQPGTTYLATVAVQTSVSDKPLTGTQCQVKVTTEAEKPKPKVPGVEIDKTVNSKEHVTVEVGEEFTYELVVRNTGEVDLTNAKVTDRAPAGVTLLSADKGTVATNGSTWSYTIPSLKVEEEATFTLTAVVKKYVKGKLVNTACVDAKEVNPNKPGDDDCDDATVDVKKPKEPPVKPPVEKVDACNTETGEIEKVEKGKENTPPHTTDLTKCEDEEEEGDAVVCDPETGEIITVKESEAENYEPKDSEKCKETPPAPEPEEPKPPVQVMPETGLSESLSGILGLGALTTATYYYVASRRNG